MSRPSAKLRHRVRQRAQNLCEYCHTLLDLTGHEFTLDHIIPESQGGTSDFQNLCFCCF
jgi:5-methylcytosine-specific restriction endonuclease McrA